jgi:hypothetical protein
LTRNAIRLLNFFRNDIDKLYRVADGILKRG